MDRFECKLNLYSFPSHYVATNTLKPMLMLMMMLKINYVLYDFNIVDIDVGSAEITYHYQF